MYNDKPEETIRLKPVNSWASVDVAFYKSSKFPYIVYNLVKTYGGSHGLGMYLAAKATVETQRFTSRVFKEQNNFFGMRCPKQRETTMYECRSNYAYFKTYADSVRDYLLWWSQKGVSVSQMNTWVLYDLIYNEKYMFPKYPYYEADFEKYVNLVNYQLKGLIKYNAI